MTGCDAAGGARRTQRLCCGISTPRREVARNLQLRDQIAAVGSRFDRRERCSASGNRSHGCWDVGAGACIALARARMAMASSDCHGCGVMRVTTLFAMWLDSRRNLHGPAAVGKGLRGAKGRDPASLALTGSGRGRSAERSCGAIMHSNKVSATAIRVRGGQQRLNHSNGRSSRRPGRSAGPILLGPGRPSRLVRPVVLAWTGVGIERCSRLGIWRLRQLV